MIRRRVRRDDLTAGLTAIAVKSDDSVTVVVSKSIPARLQRAGGRGALRAARRAGWTQNPVPAALLLFTAASLWRAAIASSARRFAVAGSSAALILAVTLGVVLTGPAQSPPVRAVITPVTGSSTPHAGRAAKRAAHSGRAQTPGPGRARVVAHHQSRGAPARSARPTSSGATPTSATSTPTGSSSSPEPSSSPDPSPSPSPTKKRHCIILLLC